MLARACQGGKNQILCFCRTEEACFISNNVNARHEESKGKGPKQLAFVASRARYAGRGSDCVQPTQCTPTQSTNDQINQLASSWMEVVEHTELVRAHSSAVLRILCFCK